MEELLVAGRQVFSELKKLWVWNKTNGGMGTFYGSKHELSTMAVDASTNVSVTLKATRSENVLGRCRVVRSAGGPTKPR